MTASAWRRAAAAAGVIAAVLAVLALAAGGARAIGLRWDPFDLQGRRLEAARREAAQGDAERLGRALENRGRDAQQAFAERVRQTEIAVASATAAATADARRAVDAEIALDLDRRERLRAHDRELCRLALELEGCAASAASP